jgi:hypothetical protein
VATLASVVQAALETNAPTEWTEIFSPTERGALDYPIFVAFLLLLFGGLPVAVYGLLGHREWTRPADQRLRFVHVPYAVLPFQIGSVLWSAICLCVLTPDVVTLLPLGTVNGPSLFLPSYFIAQLVAGIAAIPVWRRHMLNSSAEACSLIPKRLRADSPAGTRGRQ